MQPFDLKLATISDSAPISPYQMQFETFKANFDLDALKDDDFCPEMPKLRSDRVINNFDPAMLDGLWYEHAFIDPVQIGAKCQTYTGTHNAETGVVDMLYSMKYPDWLMKDPYTFTESYKPLDSDVKGWFSGFATVLPVEIPTVIVDVTEEYMILYSCAYPLHKYKFEPLCFFTKEPTIEDELLEKMKGIARDVGVIWDDAMVKRVDFSKCNI